MRPHGSAVDVEDAGRAARLEIALLVEHRVVRQALLAIDLRRRGRRAARRARCSSCRRRAPGKPTSTGVSVHRRRERAELARAGVEERRAQQQVFRRVAAQRQLGRDDEPRAGALAPRRRRRGSRRALPERSPTTWLSCAIAICMSHILTLRQSSAARRHALRCACRARENRLPDALRRAPVTRRPARRPASSFATTSTLAAIARRGLGRARRRPAVPVARVPVARCTRPAARRPRTGWRPRYLTAWRDGDARRRAAALREDALATANTCSTGPGRTPFAATAAATIRSSSPRFRSRRRRDRGSSRATTRRGAALLARALGRLHGGAVRAALLVAARPVSRRRGSRDSARAPG